MDAEETPTERRADPIDRILGDYVTGLAAALRGGQALRRSRANIDLPDNLIAAELARAARESIAGLAIIVQHAEWVAGRGSVTRERRGPATAELPQAGPRSAWRSWPAVAGLTTALAALLAALAALWHGKH